MPPKISIITPTYNHEDYVPFCIESVLAQSFRNWEQIVVDDNSRDKTLEIASSYSNKDPRVRVIAHEKNWGIGKLADSYNQALKAAKGEFIAILEGDDFWPDDKLEKQLKSLKNPNTVLSFGDCIMTDRMGLPIKLFSYRQKSGFLNNDPPGSILKLFADLNFFIAPCTVMIRKSYLLEAGGFSRDGSYPFADIPTFLKLSLKGKFGYQREILGYYRKQKSSAWFGFAYKTPDMGRTKVQKCFYNFLSENSSLPGIKNIIQQKRAVERSQSEFLKTKRKKRELSLLLNAIAFGQKRQIENSLKNLFPDTRENPLFNRVIIPTVSYLLLRLRILNLLFYPRYALYKVEKKLLP